VHLCEPPCGACAGVRKIRHVSTKRADATCDADAELPRPEPLHGAYADESLADSADAELLRELDGHGADADAELPRPRDVAHAVGDAERQRPEQKLDARDAFAAGQRPKKI
jgi:hypothetical protein